MIDELLQLFFPVRCVGCRKLDPDALCGSCRQEIPRNPIPFYRPEFHAGLGLGFYERPLREAVHALKFGQKKMVAKILAELLRERIFPRDWKIDLITSVPLNSGRIRKRGFNQSAVLAMKTAKLLNLPCRELLRVNRKIKHQVGLNRKERFDNVRDAFALRSRADIGGKAILLVDDVVTTGATMRECASTLFRAGADQVYGACVAIEKEKRK